MRMKYLNYRVLSDLELSIEPPEVEVRIEIPRGSFLKRGSTGHIDFISPFPCPYKLWFRTKFLRAGGGSFGCTDSWPKTVTWDQHRSKGMGSSDVD